MPITLPMSNMKRHTLPPFLVGKITEQIYLNWLRRKADAHKRRDRQRGFQEVTATKYRDAIHEAVLCSDGRDTYTGEMLDWTLISQYDNDASKEGRHHYKARFAMLPTLDHVEASAHSASFVICAWRTNDAKNDLSHSDFLALCEKVLRYAGYSVDSNGRVLGSW